MKQSTIIFGAILFAYVVYITMRGQLPAFLDLFSSAPSSGKKGKADVVEGPTPSPSAIGGIVNDLIDKATKFGKVI